jgi:poly(A) polymerase
VGIDLLVDTGLAEFVLPEVSALRLEADEHHRHKDVYQHSLQVLEQAAALETGPTAPCPAPTSSCGSQR